MSEETRHLDEWLERMGNTGYINRLARGFGHSPGLKRNGPIVVDMSSYQASAATESAEAPGYQTLLNYCLLATDRNQFPGHHNPPPKKQRAAVLSAMPWWGNLSVGIFWLLCLLGLSCWFLVGQDFSLMLSTLGDHDFWLSVYQRWQDFEWSTQELSEIKKSYAQRITQNISLGWREILSTALLLLGIGVIYIALLNLFLPSLLQYQMPMMPIIEHFFSREIGWINTLRKLPFWEWVLKKLAVMERAAWRRWLRLRVFGAWRHAPLVIVVIREVRLLTDQDKEGLRELFSLKRRSQSLLYITHTGGLSHLVNCHLDVCLPENESLANHEFDEMFVIHDRESAAISASEVDNKASDKESREDNLATVAGILGWPQQTAEKDQVSQRELYNSLADETWVINDILPALILGSSPFTQMTLAKKHVRDLTQYKTELEAELLPYQRLFQQENPVQLSESSVAVTFACADRASGLLTAIIKYHNRDFVFIMGRSGGRKKLAKALRAGFPDQSQAVSYLVKLITCGEVFNLKQIIHSLQDEEWPGHRLPNGSELPIYMEAALFLLNERMALQRNAELSKSVWLQLQETMDNSTAALNADDAKLATVDAGRCYCILLSALQTLELLDETTCYELANAITRRCIEFKPQETHTVQDAFLNDVASSVRNQMLLDNRSAAKLLDSKFKSDWFHAPESLKKAIKNIVLKISSPLLQSFLKFREERALFEIVTVINRPAVIISTLAWLALQYAKSEFSGAEQQARLFQLANFINHFKDFLNESGDLATAIIPPARFEANQAKVIFELVMNEGFATGLMTALLQSRERQSKLRQQIADLPPIQLEGVAWGSYNQANRLIENLAEDLHQLNIVA